jgi:hypothetical protein
MRLRRAVLSAAVLATASTPALAGTVTATFNSASPSLALSFVSPVGIASGQTGVYNWTRTGGDHVGTPTGNFSTFCIELNQHISFGGSYTYTVMKLEDAPNPGLPEPGVNGMGAVKAANLKKLWAAYRDSIGTDAVKAAAFQVAVWEVVYEDIGTYDTSAGDFYINTVSSTANSVRTQANTWLNFLSSLTMQANLAALSSESYQDQLVVVPTPTGVTAGAGLLAVVGIIGNRRRRFE